MRDQSKASQLVETLRHPTLDLNVFREIIKILIYSQENTRKGAKDNIKDHRFEAVLERDVENYSKFCGHLYMKNICKVLRRRVELCAKKDFMLHAKWKERKPDVSSPSMATIFFN